ncbi:hypothetical protein [Flavobacterium oreochromis]|uniref:hypothetical protein n=1 Tax=Flavobacterium oreochromis TaxID=2906078 RepID=UPI003859F73E
MELKTLPMGFNQLSYDEFTWSDNDRVSSNNKILIEIPIDDIQLRQLSTSIYSNYLKIVKEVPDYFDNWDEPFPDSDIEIYNNPEKLLLYFSKSSLWSDFLIKEISRIQNWKFTDSIYHVLKTTELKVLNNDLSIVMLSIKL